MHYYHNQYWKSVSPNGMKNCMIWRLNELFSLLFIIQKYRQINVVWQFDFLMGHKANGHFDFDIIRFDSVIPISLNSVKLNMLSSLHAYFESLTKEWYKLTRTSSFVLSETKRQKCPFSPSHLKSQRHLFFLITIRISFHLDSSISTRIFWSSSS